MKRELDHLPITAMLVSTGNTLPHETELNVAHFSYNDRGVLAKYLYTSEKIKNPTTWEITPEAIVSP